MEPKEIIVDGQAYVRKEVGSRYVVVVDRGWIFAGDLRRDGDYLILDDAVWIFRWESIGFDGVIANPASNKVTIKPMGQSVEIPVSSEIFRVPVPAGWGLK